MDIVMNPTTDRQRRTRNALGATAAYAAGVAARRLLGGTIPRPVCQPSVAALVRATHEPKNLDISSTGGTFSTTAYTLNPLNLIVQGVTGNTRTGRQVRLESLRLSFNFQNQTAVSEDLIRVMVVYDKETRGTSPGSGDILQVNTFGLAQLNSSWNFDNVPTRFQILVDKVMSLTPTVSTSSTNAAWNSPDNHLLVNVKIGRQTHFYNTSAGTVADIDSGGLFLILMGKNGTSGSAYSYDSRLVFRDL